MGGVVVPARVPDQVEVEAGEPQRWLEQPHGQVGRHPPQQPLGPVLTKSDWLTSSGATRKLETCTATRRRSFRQSSSVSTMLPGEPSGETTRWSGRLRSQPRQQRSQRLCLAVVGHAGDERAPGAGRVEGRLAGKVRSRSASPQSSRGSSATARGVRSSRRPLRTSRGSPYRARSRARAWLAADWLSESPIVDSSPDPATLSNFLPGGTRY